jgi:carboxylesterase type B
MGFFTTLDGEVPGNNGLMDQSAALMWIKENIKAFGGDDENITLMGHGGGATSVSAHLLSKEWTEGFFHKAIVMSGSALERGRVRMPHEYKKIIDGTASAFSCFRTPTAQLVECLRNIDAKLLVDNAPEQHWGPVVDGGHTNTSVPFISENPEDLVEHGYLRKVPLLTGFTNQEDVYDLAADQMVEHGISLDMFDLMIDEIVRGDFARVENNETMCSGNNQIAMEAVNFLYRPYPPTEDKIKLRNFFVHFLNDRKYLAPTIATAAHMSKQSDTYVYRFDLKPRTMIDLPEDLGVPHGFEQVTIKNYHFSTLKIF